MSVQVQTISENAYGDNNLKMSSTRASSSSRLPFQPRNPNTYVVSAMGSLSSSGAEDASCSRETANRLSTLECSGNENNRARFNSMSRRSSSNIMGYPESGTENNSSTAAIVGPGTASSRGGMYNRSSSSIGNDSNGDNRGSEQLFKAPTKPLQRSSSAGRALDLDQEVIIEEKRRKVNGDGYTIHRYLRGRLLGKGGFAKVYMCTALDTNKSYAVKIVSKSNLVKARARQKLQAEIKIHRTLKHKHICEYKHFFEDRHNCYILLELCHNQSMNELIKRRKRLSEPEAIYFMTQMIDAVDYMHDQCVIHRDLKLGNLFLDKDLNIKVGDLGLATKLASPDEKRQTICGTPNYIAPEVIQGSKETRGHSFEVDIWSMGVILFTSLVGKPPYEARDVKATYQRIIANEYNFPSHVEVSSAARGLITLMLQSNPRDRPTLNEMRAHPFLNNQAPTKLPVSVLHSMPEWTMNEHGELVVLPRQGSSHGLRKSLFPPSKASAARRQPLADKDLNAVEQRHQEKQDREVRDVRIRVESTAVSTQLTNSPGFRIFDESSTPAELQQAPSKHLKPPQGRSSVTTQLEKLAARASALMEDPKPETSPPQPPPPPPKAQSQPQQPSQPQPVQRSTSADSDSEVLVRMLHTLTDVLDVAEARKFSYGDSLVRPSSKGGSALWVTRYVDYTSKYGLGFLLNDGSSGVYFNDSTKAVLEYEGETFQYIERKRVETSEVGVKRTEPSCETHTLSTFPEALQKKVTLLKHFRNYLVEQQKKADDDRPAVTAVGAARDPTHMVYLKKWVRTKHAILFRLSNQTVQIVFYDQTEVLLTPDERYITYVDKKRQRLSYHLTDQLVGSNAEMAKRLKYAKEILNQLLTGQQRR